jgi:hypothetical protein
VVTAVRTPLQTLSVIALLLAAPALAGCGGGAHAVSAANAEQAHGAYLAGVDLERQLGNAFRQGLYRMAVMTQRSDEAKDLGQPLPTGLLDRVRCASSAPRPSGGGPWAWTCDVGWKTVKGKHQSTRYSVRLWRGECFAAGATPQRRPRYDATIRTYSEDPLNVLTGVRREC